MSASTSALSQGTIDVAGAATNYWQTGEGPPLVLIHGGGAGADAWGNWAGCLPTFGQRFRAIAYDVIGFGRTTAPETGFVYSQPARVEHLRGFLDALGLDRVAIAGNSMGGATALGLAMRYPERVERLVLMGSAGLTREFSPQLRTILDYREPSLDGMWQIARALTHEGFQPSEEMVRYRYELTCDERVMDAYRSTMRAVQEAGGLYYPEPEIAAITVPTLIVSGREDAVVPLALSVRFHELLDNSWLSTIPHCGHWAMIEHPATFTAATTRFLTGA
jgi:2-hydroxy-6-oxo-6-(2'-aminophenyl)hexa-2,4-dienoate hydrolase